MTTTLLFGDLRTGKITDTLDATGCTWKQVLNDAGSIDQVVIEGHEVREKNLRYDAAAVRTFLAVDVDGRIQEAGPIWSRTWDDATQRLTLGASGLWSIFDHRKVLPPPEWYTTRVQDVVMSSGLVELGSIGRQLVAQTLYHVGGSLPLVLPDVVAGGHIENWYGWQLLWVGDQLRQLTTRQDGPDIRFRPTYTADRMSIQWVYEAGTDANPRLTQVGDDWFFDKTAPKSPVVKIYTDEDATVMGMRSWITGNGMENDILMSTAQDLTLIDAGWPLLEVDESRSTVEQQDTLNGHAENLLNRSARPIEVWKVVVRPEAAAEVQSGDYARVIVGEDHPWLPTGEAYMRVKSKSGGLTGDVTLEMYAVQAVL